MSYYDKKNQPYVNSYANPGSAYTLTTPKYNAAVKREQNRQQNEQIVKAAEEKRANIAANIDPRITQRQNQSTYTPPSNNDSGGDLGGDAPADPYASYYNKMISLYEKQLADEKARQEAIKQSRINTANKVYDTSLANLNDATESSLRQAYIKHMHEQKALPQQMQAYGISGGATETNLANMKNVYGTNRANIQAENIAQQRMIEQDRANAIMAAEADAADYEASAVREYNNGLLNTYASALSKPTSTATSTSNITKNPWYNVALGMIADEGMTETQVITELRNRGVSDDIIDAILYSWESTI